MDRSIRRNSKKSYSDYTRSHCDLDLEVSTPAFSHDTPAYNDA